MVIKLCYVAVEHRDYDAVSASAYMYAQIRRSIATLVSANRKKAQRRKSQIWLVRGDINKPIRWLLGFTPTARPACKGGSYEK